MASTIKIKNSSTASAVPTSSDLVQGELAVNVTDKRIYTENASGTIVELGTNPSIPVTFPDGSASAPSLTNDGDTNTGVYFPAADTVGVTTGGTERVRVDSSGNVGIGTSSPTSKLGIAATAGNNAYIEVAGNGNTLGGTSALYGQDSGNVAYCWNRANAALLFGTNGTERARIDSSGNLLVGTTSAAAVLTVLGRSGVSPCSVAVNANGDSAVTIRNSSGSAVGSIVANASTTTYNTSSDYRLKENITPMTGGLSVVAALKPCTYTWKIDGSDGQGFIAHELQAVVPDAVVGEKDAIDENGNPKYQGIDTSFLVATLTAAIQELKATVDAQAARITALEQA